MNTPLSLTQYEKILVILFLFTLPLSNPWVRGDGVGYYAFARSMLIEHRLDFTKDWLAANTSFRMGRIDPEGHVASDQYTVTNHLDNHFSVGPAILWSPFLIVAHGGVLLYNRLGGHIPADGFSRPYRVAMALGTSLCGFLSVFISFDLARRYMPERWAFLAAFGIWFGSSLPVYMYFNPSWSHAQSAFVVAAFLWYWIGTRGAQSWAKWAVLGALGGLMMDVNYANFILLPLPLIESLVGHGRAARERAKEPVGRLFLKNLLFFAVVFAAFLPTLITKKIIYGTYFKSGYENLWNWTSPAMLKACVSSDHGLFSWNPIVIPAVVGLFSLRRYDKKLSTYLILVFLVFLYVIGCYQAWDGLSSFGNRYFVSLTVLYVLGLAAFFDWLSHKWRQRGEEIFAWCGTAALVLWNLGLIFQWGTHLVPARGPISWRVVAYNQFTAVPMEATRTLKSYLINRGQLMERIEREDVNQLKSVQPEGTK